MPNATVMVVEHAERFGLSQLHQLRGRVGRGAARSSLPAARPAPHGRRRRRGAARGAGARTQDGFELARADLKLRGPGELLGTRQSGQALLEVADLYRDEAILDEAREEAFAPRRGGSATWPPGARAAGEGAGGAVGRPALAGAGRLTVIC